MTITIQTANIKAVNLGTNAPDLIEFYVPDDFKAKVAKCVDFMRTNTVREVMIEHAFAYRLYKDVKSADASDFGGSEFVLTNGTSYAPYEPNIKVAGCHARIDVAGEVTAWMTFAQEGTEIFCKLGQLPA